MVKRIPVAVLLLAMFIDSSEFAVAILPGTRSAPIFLERSAERMCQQQETMPPCEITPWRPSPKAKVHEICQRGDGGTLKSLPKLYVLGAQKAGTSSLATDLSCTGVEPVRGTDDKEFHFFDGHSWLGDQHEKSRWLMRLPECHQKARIRGELSKTARIVTDFTPNNLRMVEGETTYSGVNVEVPKVLRKWYGEGAANNLTFVLMVREPLSRMQSAWYAASLCGYFKAICRDDCRAPTFQEALHNVLSNATKTDEREPLFTEWIWTSMYGRHLEQWLKYFKASQFYVVPYKEYSQGDADSICRYISKKLDFAIDCHSKGKGVTHLWASGHKPLKEDVTPELLVKFSEVMDEENERFVNTLANAQKYGLGLANFKGKEGNVEQIRDWLRKGW